MHKKQKGIYELLLEASGERREHTEVRVAELGKQLALLESKHRMMHEEIDIAHCSRKGAEARAAELEEALRETTEYFELERQINVVAESWERMAKPKWIGTTHYREKASWLFGWGEGLQIYSREELTREWSYDLDRLCDRIEELEDKKEGEDG